MSNSSNARLLPEYRSYFRRPRPANTPQAIVAAVQQALAVLSIELDLQSPIVPGQPLVFSWKASTIAVRPLNLGQVTFALYLVDEFGNVDSNGLLYSKTLPASTALTPANYQSPQYSTQLVGDQASRVYKFGQHVVRLVLTCTGTDGPFESADTVLVVQGEPINYTWWSWTVPQSRQVDWKNDHPAVNGTANNFSKFTALVFKATLYEDNLTDGDGIPKEIGSDQPGEGAVPSGQSAPITYGAIDFSKSWDWFVKGVWVPNGKPTDRLYSYRVELNVSDAYQNGYDPVWSEEILIEYRVSDLKWGTLSTATGLMAGAAVLFVAGAATICFGGAALISAAAGMVTAAGIAGAVAGDPPTPDVRYRQRVQVAPAPVPRKALALREFRPVAETLALTNSSLALVEALSTVTGRLMGARLAEDRIAFRQQSIDTRLLAAKLKQNAARVRTASKAAAIALTQHKTATPAAVAAAMERWRTDADFRGAVQKLFMGSGRTASEWESLERLIAIPQIRAATADPASLIRSIGFWTERFSQAGAKEATRSLRAYTLARQRSKG